SSHFELNPFLTGFIVSIALLGCAVGAWYAGRLADRWGRRRVMLLAAFLFVVDSLGSGLTFSAPDLLIWRVLNGLSIGTASVIAPAYTSEIASAATRGAFGSLQQLAITIGQLVVLTSNKTLAGTAGERRAISGSVSRRGGGCSWSGSYLLPSTVFSRS